MGIDYKKLIEQDPEFKAYLADIVIDIVLGEPNGAGLLASIHSFYTIGMTEEQVKNWMRGMKASGQI